MSDPITVGATAQQTTRELFLKGWAKMLGCGADAFEITVKLINDAKNFETATAILFGLSLRTHKDYIHDCANYWKKVWEPDQICTVEWLIAFQKHYTEEVKAYPADA